MEESILITIKKLLGLDADYDAFDMDVMVFINSALFTLNQLGVGPKEGFRITGQDETWGDFVTDSTAFESIKEYVYLVVRNTFDPPSNSSVMSAYNERINELGWRLRIQAESEDYDAGQ